MSARSCFKPQQIQAARKEPVIPLYSFSKVEVNEGSLWLQGLSPWRKSEGYRMDIPLILKALS